METVRPYPCDPGRRMERRSPRGVSSSPPHPAPPGRTPGNVVASFASFASFAFGPTLLAFLLVVAWPGLARAAGTLRTVLVIDASSSMRKTDPKELRKVGAELYVDLARDGDQIAVTGFDGAARNSTGAFVTIRGPADRDALKASIRAVGADGDWTDFTAGLGEAKRLLDLAKDEPGDQEIVVFLTDGKCDPDPKGPMAEQAKAARLTSEELCQRQVMSDVVPGLGNARLYAVGLSRSAPRAFLEQLSRRLSGDGLATEQADALPRLFADIQSRLLGSKLLEGPSAAKVPIPVEEGMISLDVVVVGPPALTLGLTDPAGKALAADNKSVTGDYLSVGHAYRLLKAGKPQPGSYTLGVGGPGSGGRYVALLGLDLELAFVALPDVAEIGRTVPVRIKLASPAGKVPPLDFLDRHQVVLRSHQATKDCGKELRAGAGTTAPLRRDAEGTFASTFTVGARGEACFEAKLTPGSGGVLTRTLASPAVRLVPPLRLAGAPLAFGKIKQGERGTAQLSLQGSEIGEAIDAKVGLVGAGEDFEIDLESVRLEPGGARTFPVRLEIDRDAPTAPRPLALVVRPDKPAGYEERAIQVEVQVEVVPLTFWERYGFWIQVGAGVLVLLLLVLGFALPAAFAKGTVLHYRDERDADLPREASYPLAVRARPGFYRAARQLVGPTGPVKAGGVVELRPGPGGAPQARLLSGGRVVELPPEDDSSGLMLASGSSEPREVRLDAERSFRVSLGVRYRIEGAGLAFWCMRAGRR